MQVLLELRVRVLISITCRERGLRAVHSNHSPTPIPTMASSKLQGRRNLWIGIGVAIAIVVIIVIVVPLAVLLPRKHHGKKATILFPLYIWPETDSTWDPLYEE